ncbi:MAG: VWA domain-containing protein [Myxococcales bacterium]|nr:VWA domain-containing protein [Myxococcales bacterium]
MLRSVLLTTALFAATGCGNEQNFFTQDWVDVFEQVPTDKVDILFVVDDSASMANEQKALAEGFRSFTRQLEVESTSFHIGVISTSQDTDDPNAGRLIGNPPFLTTEDDYVEAFRERVTLGTGGSDKEKGLQAAAVALSSHMLLLYNVGFLRTDANLLVVIVSDEDDCSDYGRLDQIEEGLPTTCYTQRDELIPVDDLLLRINAAKNFTDVQIGAIIAPFDGSCGDNTRPGFRYAEAVFQTGGTLHRICEPDWGPILEELGVNALGILRQFKLTHSANPETLEVRVNGRDIPEGNGNGWTYDQQHWVLLFHGDEVPPRGSEIVVEYEIAPYSAPAGDPDVGTVGTGG